MIRYDTHATSGKLALEESERLNNAFKHQGRWVDKQRGLLEQKRNRCEHLLFVLNEEIKKDATREIRMMDLSVDQKQRRRVMADAAKERTESADRVMRILQEYGMLSGDEMSDYYLYVVHLTQRCTL